MLLIKSIVQLTQLIYWRNKLGERGIENSVEIETIMSFEEKGLKLIDAIDFFWTNEGNIWPVSRLSQGRW